MDLRI